MDLITLPNGRDPSEYFDYFNDTFTIGSFHAMKYGILISASGGNTGPSPSTAVYLSPWLHTVAASTTNRILVSDVKLGKDKNLPPVSGNLN